MEFLNSCQNGVNVSLCWVTSERNSTAAEQCATFESTVNVSLCWVTSERNGTAAEQWATFDITVSANLISVTGVTEALFLVRCSVYIPIYIYIYICQLFKDSTVVVTPWNQIHSDTASLPSSLMLHPHCCTKCKNLLRTTYWSLLYSWQTADIFTRLTLTQSKLLYKTVTNFLYAQAQNVGHCASAEHGLFSALRFSDLVHVCMCVHLCGRPVSALGFLC
jgi:hypothetical protein